MRLAAPGFDRVEPFGREPKPALERDMVLQPRAVVRGERHDEGALTPQVDALPARRFELGGKISPQCLAGAVEGE